MLYPADLRYTKEHGWVRAEGATAVVGITDYAQKQLGDVVFVETPAVGAALTQLAPYGVVESVKSVSDLHTPVGGTVARVNEALAGTPELINKDPYGAGWTIAITLTDRQELDELLTPAEYEAYVTEAAK